MSDLWDDRVKAFLRKTGEEFRRFSHDVQQDARRLLDEARDPQRQQRVKDGLAEVGTWVRKTAEEVATVMEDGVKKAEEAIGQGSRPSGDLAQPAPTAPSDPPVAEAAPPPPAKAPRSAKKSVGPDPHKNRSTKPKGTAKKTIGRRAKPGSTRDE